MREYEVAGMDLSSGLVLVNGSKESVQGPRARALFGSTARILYKERGRLGSIPTISAGVRGHRNGWIYCIDLGIPGAPLSALLKSRAVSLILEIGDPAGPMLQAEGRSRLEVWCARFLDMHLPFMASALVFRGSFLREYFASLRPNEMFPPTHWVPDGVDVERFKPLRGSRDVARLRREHGLEGRFVIGIVGSINYSRRLDMCYGWELVEALWHLRDRPEFTGVIIGDGSGVPVLQERIRRFGLQGRVHLIGRLPHESIPLWMNTFDVGLSTQTNDVVGWGRTTAKLPEYLACGLVVVCTDVGEAHRLLGASGRQTLPYTGTRDPEYPSRLAARLVELSEMDLDETRSQNRALALEHFDYAVLRARVEGIIAESSVRN